MFKLILQAKTYLFGTNLHHLFHVEKKKVSHGLELLRKASRNQLKPKDLLVTYSI